MALIRFVNVTTILRKFWQIGLDAEIASARD